MFNYRLLLQVRLHPSSLIGVGGRSATGEDLGTSDAAPAFHSLSAEGSEVVTGTDAFDAFTLGQGLVNDETADLFRRQVSTRDAAPFAD